MADNGLGGCYQEASSLNDGVSHFLGLLLGQGFWLVCGEKLEELSCVVGLPETNHHVGTLGRESHSADDACRCAAKVADGVLDECVEVVT
jgi:hypothetical protein